MAVGSPAQRLAQTPVSDLRLVGLVGLAVQAREGADRAVQQLLLKANALLADAEKRTLSALLAERGLGRVQPEVTTRRRVVFSDHCGGSGGPVRRSARR